MTNYNIFQSAYVNRGTSELDLNQKPKRRDYFKSQIRMTNVPSYSRDTPSHIATPSVNHVNNVTNCTNTET